MITVEEIVKGIWEIEVGRTKPAKRIVPPPVINANLFEERPTPVLSDSQKAQAIMEANGLDGMEFGDDPREQRIERPLVYEIIMCLFADKWSYDRINDWCAYAKKMCTFTLNGRIVR